MKKVICILSATAVLMSCKKGGDEGGTTPVDNGPLGGTYSFSGTTSKSYDTIPGSGIVTTHEYTQTCSNFKGTITITANTISSKGLMFDYQNAGIRKETNTTTGATITTNLSYLPNSAGGAATAYSSAYTFSVAGSELSITDAQYLFNPGFLLLPASKKYKYTYAGNVLKITVDYYDASSKNRSTTEASFTKQ